MGSKNISRIIQSAYGRRYNLEYYDITSKPDFYISRLEPIFFAIKNRWLKITLALVTIVLLIGSIFYYNLLITSHWNALASKANVDALMQRRNDLVKNLSKAVIEHSGYERGLFTTIVSLRSFLPKDVLDNPKVKELMNRYEPNPSKPNSANIDPADSAKIAQDKSVIPLNPLDRLMAVAEQYPNLRAAETYSSLMTAIMDVEKDLSLERIKYNNMVNTYITNVTKFPINIFATIFRFKSKQYFEAANEAKEFRFIDGEKKINAEVKVVETKN